MNTYTVLLLRPDYLADNFGTDTYMTNVEAEDVLSAEIAAQYEVAKVDYIEDEFTFEEVLEQGNLSIEDYVVLMVIEGKHIDVKTSHYYSEKSCDYSVVSIEAVEEAPEALVLQRCMYETQRQAVQSLRDAGFAVVIWTPEDLGDADPRKVEEQITQNNLNQSFFA